MTTYTDSYFGEGSGPYHVTQLQCNGEEANLLSCSYNSVHNCKRNEDAGVKCDGKEIKLANILYNKSIKYSKAMCMQQESISLCFVFILIHK